MYQLLQPTIDEIFREKLLSEKEISHAKFLLRKHQPTVLYYGLEEIKLVFGKDNPDVADVLISIQLSNDEKKLLFALNSKTIPWNSFGLASLSYLKSFTQTVTLSKGIKYTREGMRRRVWNERWVKAKNASYKVELADNLYGEHTLINEKGEAFHITLWDFEKQTGYIDNIDWKNNKLGTTKHILFLYNYLKNHPEITQTLSKKYPFIEVSTDPFNDYRIAWFYPGELTPSELEFLEAFFGPKQYLNNDELTSFLPFLDKANAFDRIKIREEVYEKLEAHYEARELKVLQEKVPLDFSPIRATLYPYQKEGVAFSVYKSGVIIADEMGLGKTLQAIATAILKKKIFGFKKTLVICPASVKHQWINEIEKFTSESCVSIAGTPEERANLYLSDKSFFHIINYETVLRDLPSINQVMYDMVILDEAQKIKNYESKTAIAIKQIRKKHGMVITGTPLENKLLDIYSIVQFLDQSFLSPQWEFSYQHCIFDVQTKNKIIGYYNLQKLKERLNNLLIRREKHEVFDQLPQIIEKDIFVKLSSQQAKLHAEYKQVIAKILSKKIKSTYDWQRLMMMLNHMRMVCNSTFLVDKQTHISPKLVELKDILINRLNVHNSQRKIIIFSEWVMMLEEIGQMLTLEGIQYKMLSGKVPIDKRKQLLHEFEENPAFTILLSSETGGSGLNLQKADTIINFELPWNPAKKNQRLGRIDRIGQDKQRLHVFNLISQNSIEQGISRGLEFKQNLFDRLLKEDSINDKVDFSDQGRSMFLNRLKNVLEKVESPATNQTESSGMLVDGNSTWNSADQTSPLDSHEIEKLVYKGFDFINDIYQISSGKPFYKEQPKILINKQTGEVSVTFKLNSDRPKSEQ